MLAFSQLISLWLILSFLPLVIFGYFAAFMRYHQICLKFCPLISRTCVKTFSVLKTDSIP